MENTDIEKNTKNPQKHQQNAASKAPWFVSEYDRRRFSRYTPWFVYSIMIADIAIFIASMIINNCPKNYFGLDACFARFLGPFSFQRFRENPLLGPSSTTLLKMGALQWDKVVHQHQGWRLISCIWLHAGVIHLGFNMSTLSIVGLHLEQRFGFVRIGILYLVSGIGGSVLSSLFLQQNISVGASGPLFGLLGATLVELFTNWTIYPEKVASLFLIMFLVAINLAIGILPHVGNFAHIGGFLTGLLLGFIVLRCPRFELVERFPLPGNAPAKTKYQSYEMVFYYITLAALVVGFVVALVMLFKGKNGNGSCNWCHYLNCVPTSNWQCGS